MVAGDARQMEQPGRNYHRDIPFALWTDRGSWFWRFVDPRSKGGIVGAAPSRAEAMREARAAIEELLHVAQTSASRAA